MPSRENTAPEHDSSTRVSKAGASGPIPAANAQASPTNRPASSGGPVQSMNGRGERGATLHVFGAAPTHATAAVEPLGLGGRLARSLGILVACWGAAIVSIFIPVAHFFLVPGFLVLGVVLAVARGRERERILRLHGICPRCRREREFIQSGRQGGTLWVSCPGCFNRLSVTIEGSASRTTPAAAGPLTSLGTGR